MIEISPMAAAHWPEVAAIYAEGIASGNATFETTVPSWPDWDAAHLPDHRLIASEADKILGWAAVTPASSREAYRGVVEDSIYVAAAARGRGIGRQLLRALIESTDSGGIWTIKAGIFGENIASLEMHTGEGFRIVGHHERLGQLAGRWRDVVLLERRRQEPRANVGT